MRFTITHKLVITILFFASLSIVIIMLLIRPSLKSITDTTNAMVAQVQSENAEFERVRLLRRSLSEIKTVREELSKTDRIATERSEENKLIGLIELIADKHNVQQELSVSFKEYETAGPFGGYYLFSFRTTGVFENIMSYLAELESIPYYLNIGKLDLEKTSSLEGEFVTINFSATLNSFIES